MVSKYYRKLGEKEICLTQSVGQAKPLLSSLSLFLFWNSILRRTSLSVIQETGMEPPLEKLIVSSFQSPWIYTVYVYILKIVVIK